MSNGKNILISEFIHFTDHNQKDFTDKSNWFNFDEFITMINKMNWITNVRVNQGSIGDLTMNINDFKKFVNTTFKMKFELPKQNEDISDQKNNNNNNKKSKFNVRSKFSFSYSNRNKTNRNNNSKQKNIMEAMRARLREMVSHINTNDIHHQIKRPVLPIPQSSKQIMRLSFSDTYGFTKYHFYNPFIKEFNIELMGNFVNIYRSKIDPNKPNHVRDFKTAIYRAPIGKSCFH